MLDTVVAWSRVLGIVVGVMLAMMAFGAAVWVATQAPLVSVVLAGGAYGLWRLHQHDLAQRRLS